MPLQTLLQEVGLLHGAKGTLPGQQFACDRSTHGPRDIAHPNVAAHATPDSASPCKVCHRPLHIPVREGFWQCMLYARHATAQMCFVEQLI